MHATATEVKNRFGEFLEEARKAPVIVERNGRRTAVLMSYDDFERLVAGQHAGQSANVLRDRAQGAGFAGAPAPAPLEVMEGSWEEMRDRIGNLGSRNVRVIVLPDIMQDAAAPRRTLADRFAGRTGVVRRGGGEHLSREGGTVFTDYLERKRREGRL